MAPLPPGVSPCEGEPALNELSTSGVSRDTYRSQVCSGCPLAIGCELNGSMQRPSPSSSDVRSGSANPTISGRRARSPRGHHSMAASPIRNRISSLGTRLPRATSHCSSPSRTY